MRYVCLTCTLLLCLVFSPLTLRAQTQATASTTAAGSTVAATTPSVPVAVANPQTPEEFFARARQLSDLEASGIPFHLKATYVASGDTEFTGNGTYEEWWQSKDVWRKEATLGNYKYVAIQNGGDESDYASSFYSPLRLRQAMELSLLRIAEGIDNSSKWEKQHQTISGMDLTVLSHTYICSDANNSIQCLIKDFFTSEGMFRVHTNGAIINLYNSFQPFQGLLIPRSITTTTAGRTILTISIDKLEPLNANEPQLSKDAPVPANMHSVTRPLNVKLGPGVRPSKLIHSVQPVYPMAAKQARIQGTVVVNASIDETGKVREPYILVSSGTQFDDAALDAVRGWKYEPLQIDGVPYSIDTTISVVFTLSR